MGTFFFGRFFVASSEIISLPSPPSPTSNRFLEYSAQTTAYFLKFPNSPPTQFEMDLQAEFEQEQQTQMVCYTSRLHAPFLLHGFRCSAGLLGVVPNPRHSSPRFVSLRWLRTRGRVMITYLYQTFCFPLFLPQTTTSPFPSLSLSLRQDIAVCPT